MMIKSINGMFCDPPIARPGDYIRRSKTEDYLSRDPVESAANRFQFAPAQPASLEDLVVKLMKRDDHDFQTVQWIADQLATDPTEIRAVLANSRKVRRPVYGGGKFADWYRLRKRGLTRREQFARWRALITFESMDDDY